MTNLWFRDVTVIVCIELSAWNFLWWVGQWMLVLLFLLYFVLLPKIYSNGMCFICSVLKKWKDMKSCFTHFPHVGCFFFRYLFAFVMIYGGAWFCIWFVSIIFGMIVHVWRMCDIQKLWLSIAMLILFCSRLVSSYICSLSWFFSPWFSLFNPPSLKHFATL